MALISSRNSTSSGGRAWRIIVSPAFVQRFIAGHLLSLPARTSLQTTERLCVCVSLAAGVTVLGGGGVRDVEEVVRSYEVAALGSSASTPAVSVVSLSPGTGSFEPVRTGGGSQLCFLH